MIKKTFAIITGLLCFLGQGIKYLKDLITNPLQTLALSLNFITHDCLVFFIIFALINVFFFIAGSKKAYKNIYWSIITYAVLNVLEVALYAASKY